eukprot:scaffold63984_cov61-Cyclotella_meneghiniana.AAC.7
MPSVMPRTPRDWHLMPGDSRKMPRQQGWVSWVFHGAQNCQQGESKADMEGAETVVFGGAPPGPLNRNG